MWFFFSKQRTAYEMRISDWSSDVCSSDLPGQRREPRPQRLLPRPVRRHERARRLPDPQLLRGLAGRGLRARPGGRPRLLIATAAHSHHLDPIDETSRPVSLHRKLGPQRAGRGHARLEEHTSELQSLLRISYAVFCLKKKKL